MEKAATTDDRKYVFGAFLNTAFDNFNDVVKYICTTEKTIKTTNEKGEENEKTRVEGIIKFLKEEKNLTSLRIEDALKRAFPFWDDIIKKDSNGMENPFEIDGERLCLLFDTLNELRNYYTHAIHPQPQPCDAINDLLRYTFDKAIKKVRHDFQFNNDDSYKHLYAVEYNDKKLFYSPASYYAPTKGNGEFSDNGLVFFICLFLHGREAYRFLKQLKGFKRDDEPRYKMTLEAFTAMSFHSPKKLAKFQQRDGDKESIGMDMLNELVKCPKELYYHLTKCKQEDYETGDEENPGKLVRGKDRYETMMLKALEYSDEFKEIGFYMGVGKCYIRNYMKSYIDGTRDMRYITHPLYVIGHMLNSYKPHGEDEGGDDNGCLSAFGGKLERQGDWGVAHLGPDNNPDTPYVSEAYPYYILNNKNIGIKFLPPEKEITIDEFPVFKDGKVRNPKPDYWMSKYELPAMSFYAYLKETHKDKLKDSPSIKSIIANYQDKLRSPSKTGKDELTRKRLKVYIERIDEKIWKLAEGKVKGNGEMAGELARDILWLQPSRNVGKDKLTGANFQALQSALARYSFMRDSLTRIFATAEAGLTTGTNAHPFLKEINPKDHSTLASFYNAYLVKEKKYVERQQTKLAKEVDISVNFHPFRKHDPRNAKQLATVRLPRGIFTEHIKEALCKLGCKDIETEINDLSMVGTTKLIDIYMRKFMKDGYPTVYNEKRNYKDLDDREEDKEGQTVRAVETVWMGMDELNEHIKKEKVKLNGKLKELREQDTPDGKKIKMLVKINHVDDNEKKIRLRRTQDVTTFLWMMNFVGDKINETLSSAHEIVKEKDDKGKVIDQKAPKIKEEVFKIMFNNICKDTLATPVKVSKNINVNGKSIVIEDKDVKLRDYGRVMALTTEALPNSLFKFIDDIYRLQECEKEDELRNALKYAYINEELGSFYKHRIDVIRMSQEIEKHVIDDLVVNIKKTKDRYKFNDVVRGLKESHPEIDANALYLIRNGFCHGDYILYDKHTTEDIKMARWEKVGWRQFTPNKAGGKDDETLAYKLCEIFKIEYEKVMELS